MEISFWTGKNGKKERMMGSRWYEEISTCFGYVSEQILIYGSVYLPVIYATGNAAAA